MKKEVEILKEQLQIAEKAGFRIDTDGCGYVPQAASKRYFSFD
ncbi:MAG: hypothetical protein ACLT16_09655 [[Clostridium] innocuum]